MKFNLQGFENILAREDLRQIKIGTINYSLPFFLLEKMADLLVQRYLNLWRLNLYGN